MKKFTGFAIALYLLATIAAVAQRSSYTSPNTPVTRPYPKGAVVAPWSGDSHDYDYSKAYSGADVTCRGIIDTTQGPNAGTTDTAWVYYYGRIWQASVGDSLVSLQIIGRDSSTINVHYRYVSYTSNTYGAGPWIPWIGANTTITTVRGGGATLSEGDTLITVANPPLITKNTAIQFRYRVRSDRARKVAGLKRQINEPSTTQFYSFVGEMILHWRRSHR